MLVAWDLADVEASALKLLRVATNCSRTSFEIDTDPNPGRIRRSGSCFSLLLLETFCNLVSLLFIDFWFEEERFLLMISECTRHDHQLGFSGV